MTMLEHDEHSPTNAAAVTCFRCHGAWGGLVYDPVFDQFEHRDPEECVSRTRG